MWRILIALKLCPKYNLPVRSSTLVLVSMSDLNLPMTGGLKGTMVGTATAPAVILYKDALQSEREKYHHISKVVE